MANNSNISIPLESDNVHKTYFMCLIEFCEAKQKKTKYKHKRIAKTKCKATIQQKVRMQVEKGKKESLRPNIIPFDGTEKVKQPKLMSLRLCTIINYYFRCVIVCWNQSEKVNTKIFIRKLQSKRSIEGDNENESEMDWVHRNHWIVSVFGWPTDNSLSIWNISRQRYEHNYLLASFFSSLLFFRIPFCQHF